MAHEPTEEGSMASFEVRWMGGEPNRRKALAAPLIVTGRDWTDALETALHRHGLDAQVLTRAVCLLKGDGSVEVSDPDSASSFTVRQVEGDEAPLDPPSLDDLALQSLADEDGLDAPLPAHLLPQGPTEDELRALDAALAALPETDFDGLAGQVLDMLLTRVPAESAAVLLHEPLARRVRFVASRGPASGALYRLTLPEDRGIVGVVLRTGTSLLVNEVGRSPSHFSRVDAEAGYQTRTLLAVPVTVGGRCAAVVELLNPFGGGTFGEGHRQAAERAALRLGRALSHDPGA